MYPLAVLVGIILVVWLNKNKSCNFVSLLCGVISREMAISSFIFIVPVASAAKIQVQHRNEGRFRNSSPGRLPVITHSSFLLHPFECSRCRGLFLVHILVLKCLSLFVIFPVSFFLLLGDNMGQETLVQRRYLCYKVNREIANRLLRETGSLRT